MSANRILLAGVSGGGAQNHQAAMWAPSLAPAGLVPVAVWVPSTTTEVEVEHARALAERHQVDLQISDEPEVDADGAIACLRGRDRIRFLTYAAERTMPVLVDKPTLDPTGELEPLTDIPGLAVLAGHHFSAHPGFTRALTAVRSAEIGLLRSVAAELVVGSEDGPCPEGELRNLGVYLVEMLRHATGPATVTLNAHATESGDAWTFLGQTERDVVVNAHVSRTVRDAGGGGILRASIRFVGTHGSTRVDLTGPTLDVRRPTLTQAIPFGESSVTALMRRFAGILNGTARATPAEDFLVLSRALDAIAQSAATRTATTLTW
ncbi:MAG: hypothetical protein ACQEW8_15015 [Actinomycetota bacterium]